MATKPIIRKLKRIFIVLVMFIIVFIGYVEIVNRNSRNMTYRQKVLKAVYPAWMWFANLTGKNSKELAGSKQPPVSFYTLKAVENNGTVLDFATLKGKKIMLVNTASDCGYTDQYKDLQQLYEENKDSLVIIGFPANDFKEQEKGTDEDIAKFCKANYGVTFTLMKKSTVIRSPQQNAIYQWLTDSAKNGWNNQPPSWNFSKYIVNEEGILTNYFGPTISPMAKDVSEAIK